MAKKPTRPSPGRPSYRPSLDDRMTVEQMKFCGEGNDGIARALGISTPTLLKHFPDEIANGHASRRREVIGMLFKSARDGNVSAQKKLEELGKVAGAAEALNRRAAPEPKRGKKEEQQLAAQRVGGKFAPPPPPTKPQLIVSNG